MRSLKFSAIERSFSCDLFPEYNNSVWYIYVLTDVHRSVLTCGICSNLNRFLKLMAQTVKLAPSFGQAAPSRMVFIEGISSQYQAEESLNRISSFTRIQKEKLIRKNNPNWTDLSLKLKIRTENFNVETSEFPRIRRSHNLKLSENRHKLSQHE